MPACPSVSHVGTVTRIRGRSTRSFLSPSYCPTPDNWVHLAIAWQRCDAFSTLRPFYQSLDLSRAPARRFVPQLLARASRLPRLATPVFCSPSPVRSPPSAYPATLSAVRLAFGPVRVGRSTSPRARLGTAELNLESAIVCVHTILIEAFNIGVYIQNSEVSGD